MLYKNIVICLTLCAFGNGVPVKIEFDLKFRFINSGLPRFYKDLFHYNKVSHSISIIDLVLLCDIMIRRFFKNNFLKIFAFICK